jgi:predicted DCC family thiol-disulfide oxidoreductase YuxK
MTPAAAPYLVFYDGLCRICRRSRSIVERLRPSAPVRFVDVNDPAQMARFPHLPEVHVRGQMYVVDPAGHVAGGYDALVSLSTILPALSPLTWFLRLPPLRALGHRAYRWIADNRYRLGGEKPCHDGACGLHPMPAGRG